MPRFVVGPADGRQLRGVLLEEAVLVVEAEPLVVGVGALLVLVVAGDEPRVPLDEVGVLQARQELLDELDDLEGGRP